MGSDIWKCLIIVIYVNEWPFLAVLSTANRTDGGACWCPEGPKNGITKSGWITRTFLSDSLARVFRSPSQMFSWSVSTIVPTLLHRTKSAARMSRERCPAINLAPPVPNTGLVFASKMVHSVTVEFRHFGPHWPPTDRAPRSKCGLIGNERARETRRRPSESLLESEIN